MHSFWKDSEMLPYDTEDTGHRTLFWPTTRVNTTQRGPRQGIVESSLQDLIFFLMFTYF